MSKKPKTKPKPKKKQYTKFVIAFPTDWRVRRSLLSEIAMSIELHSFEWNDEDTLLTVILRTRDAYYVMDFNELIESFSGVVISEVDV